MGRIRKIFKRGAPKRDQKRLFVIATEGEKTEKNYFNELKNSNGVDEKVIKVEILETIEGKSSPIDVIKRLDKFKSTYHLYQLDELWIVIDYDSWGIEKLKDVAKLCKQKKYKLAVSNPCFEIWLLLHGVDVSKFSEDEKDLLLENKKVNRSRRLLDEKLKEEFGNYRKSNCKFEKYLPKIKDAIANSNKLNPNVRVGWSKELSTFVSKLAEELLQ